MSKELIDEMMEKHREVKAKLLEITEKATSPHISKQRIGDELFKLYQELK